MRILYHSSISSIYSISSQELDHKGTTTISFLAGENQVYSIIKTDKSSWPPVTADELVLDRDGTVVDKKLFSEKPVNV